MAELLISRTYDVRIYRIVLAVDVKKPLWEKTMTQDTKEQIALARFKLISPVLAEPTRQQNDYFRQQAQRTHDFPHYGPKKVALSTFKLWLREYRKRGFEGLKPKSRSDSGRHRRLSKESLAAIRGKCKAYPKCSAQMLYENLLQEGQLGDPPVSYNTLLRTIRREGLFVDNKSTQARKRFEYEETNELWLCDFMHGPQVRVGDRLAKAILCAIIDDHSRMIVGFAFNTNENLSTLITVLKEALSAHGVPKRLYVDNGSAFSADQLYTSCARAKISLIHSKPYDSASRGKIERFFRTVRDRFLVQLVSEVSLDEINKAFSLWLRDSYHHKVHSGVNQRPVDRYRASLNRVDIRRLTTSELDELFLVRHKRIVANDSTISFKGRTYEAPSAFMGQRIDIRHPIDDMEQLYLYENDARIVKLKLVDVKENARAFRPTKSENTLSFSKERINK